MSNTEGLLSRTAFLRTSSALVAATQLGDLRTASAQTSPLQVGAGLIEAQAEAYFARDAGFFKQQNLDVTVLTSQNGAATAAAVAGGDLQIGVTSVLSLAQAHLRGLPFVIIAPGGIHDSRYSSNAILVAPDSTVQSAKDLNGKIVGVATLNGLDQLLVSALVDKAGGDFTTLKFIEVKPVLMLDALLSRRIDAACMEDPELDAARPRTRSLGDGENAIAKVFVETAWFTTNPWLAKNADVARRFREAIFGAGKWAMANQDKAGLILQKTLHVNQARGEQRYATQTNLVDFQVLIDAGAKYKLISWVNVADFLWPAK